MMAGWALRVVLLWGAVALVTYSFVVRFGPHSDAPAAAPIAAVQMPSAAAPVSRTMVNSMVFRANERGHVVLDAAVNGAETRFMVDTGATLVALSRRDAEAAGLANLNFTKPLSTANGRTYGAPVTLRELRIGQFIMEDVSAVVIDDLSISLLGQSFLNRLDSYEMRDGVLTLTWN